MTIRNTRCTAGVASIHSGQDLALEVLESPKSAMETSPLQPCCHTESAAKEPGGWMGLFVRRRCLAGMCILFLLTGCGYRVAGRGDRLPTNVQTIAVPIFVNQSPRFRIEQQLASAVTREFIERTKYRITPEPEQADAVLKGTVKDVRAGVVTFDLNTGRATTLQIQVTSSVELFDRHDNKVLFNNPNYIFREEYQVSQNSATLFEEDQPALDRLSRDLARTLVTDILENF